MTQQSHQPLLRLYEQLLFHRNNLNPNSTSQHQLCYHLFHQLLPNITVLHDKVQDFMKGMLNQKGQETYEETIQQNTTDNKLMLYYFQLLNLAVISQQFQKDHLNQLSLQSLSKNTELFSKLQPKLYTKTFKALLVLYFNLIKKSSPQIITTTQPNPTNIQNQTNFSYLSQPLLSMLNDILQCYFNTHSTNTPASQKTSIQHSTLSAQQQQHKFQQQTQWLGYIFQTLFANHHSFLQCYLTHLAKSSKNPALQIQSQYNIMHMLGNFLSVLVQSRTTTELVKDFQCPLEDVRKLYSQTNSRQVWKVKLTETDVRVLCNFFIELVNQQKQVIKDIFLNKEDSLEKAKHVGKQWQLKEKDRQEDKLNSTLTQQHRITCGQLLLQTMGILNSLLFLGGYTPALQTLIFSLLFTNDSLPLYLQLSYLLYTQRRIISLKSLPKVNPLKPPQSNLSKLLQINYESITQQQRNELFKLISFQMKFGQLSVLLRLMTNLIHINNQALNYLQNNLKYLHMVMSLTHESEINITMKNWAVLFIKNSCDSPALRQEISKVKIQVKFQQ